MSRLEDAKILGVVGSILLIIGGMATFGRFFPISIIGFILTAVAMKYISDYFKEPAIFNNFIYYIIISIIGIFITIFLGLASIVSGFMLGKGIVILSIIATLAVLWIVIVISSIFLMRSFELTATKTGVQMFSTAGKLYFVGAILVIILVGILVIFIAEILTAVAFFSISVPEAEAHTSSQPSTTV
jgi:uncharacterized membrane protein